MKGANEITIDVSLRWRLEAIKTDYFVTPTVKFRLEGHEAGPRPRLVEDRNARGLPGTWRCVPVTEETDWSFVYISFP